MKRLRFPAVTLLFVVFFNQVIFAQAISLIIHDTRNDVTTPLSYSQSLISNFKDAGILGLPSVNSTFYTTVGFRGWIDNTGGKAHELAFSDDSRVFFRSGLSPSWERWREMVVSDENGNVGIGTTGPDARLSVNGTIHSNEVKVDSKTWPDYVFKADYVLTPLSEVKNYIDKNQHLPEMPSEQEIVKNGLNLGEMNRLLTKKVEELTLYLIELKKNNELMEERLKKVENKTRDDH